MISNIELQNAYAKTLKVAQEAGEPLFVLNESKPEAVFMSYEVWTQLVAKAGGRGRKVKSRRGKK